MAIKNGATDHQMGYSVFHRHPSFFLSMLDSGVLEAVSKPLFHNIWKPEA
jgi:hypothetical protein